MIKRISFDAQPPPATGERPLRTTVCTTLPELSEPIHHRLVIEWFTDLAHLRRCPGPAVDRVLIAEDVVLRGADWLARQHDGPKLKHLALAQRAAGLTRAEFGARWRNHAGSVGGKIIPDNARGLAYVQNHPLERGAYDALTEVYFDDLAGLRTRIEWFRANPVRDPLFGRSWFLAVREEAGQPADLGPHCAR